MFKHYVLESSGLYEKIEKSLLESIIGIRESRSIGDVSLQKNLVSMLTDSGLLSRFQSILLEITTQQYEDILEDDAAFKSFKCLELVAFWLLFERSLGSKLGFPRDLADKLVKIAEQTILMANLELIVTSGLPALIVASWNGAEVQIVEPPMNDFNELQKGQDPLFDLRLLFDLALRGNGMELVKKSWSGFIKSYGHSLLTSCPEPELIEAILQFKDRSERVLAEIFSNDLGLENAMKEAFESFLNARALKTAELIAKYLDGLLRDGKVAGSSSTERLFDEQIIQLIDNAIILFRFLQSKDAMETYYKQFLSKRILQNRSLSMALEKEVVLKFKNECGAAFTSRLEGMFKDVEAAPEIIKSFREEYPKPPKATIDFSITVVSSGIWPHPEDLKLKLPAEIAEAQKQFEAYYDGKHTGRKLAWNQNMGYCVVKAPFPQGAKELQVTVPQAVVLDCFNQAESLTFGELHKATKLDNESLAGVLESLSGGKFQILLRAGSGKPTNSEVFTYNANFSSKLVRIRLNTAAAISELVEDKGTLPAVSLEDKQYQIDATIIRTIKAAKKMPRKELVEATLLAVKIDGLPKAEVEKRVDLLIGREFMQKNSDNPAELIYLP